MTNTKHAVLFNTRSLMISTDRRVRTVELPDLCHSLYDVYDAARLYGVTHVWVHPTYGDIFIGESNENWNIFAAWEDDDEYDQFGEFVAAGAKDLPKFARIYKKGTYGEVKVGFPHRGRWGWEIETPLDILATIHYLEDTLGVPVQWSPGHMGTEVVKLLNASDRRQDWVRDASIDLFKLPFKKAGHDLYWKSDIPTIAKGMYLHQYDKRSAYLAACADLYVGAGDPVHVETVTDTTLPGVYHVKVLGKPHPFDNATLPHIIDGEQWVTADVLSYAKRMGYPLSIYEAWVWEEKHKTLASYAEKLFSSRHVFRTNPERFPHERGRKNAENTMKETALIGTGKFASEKSGKFRQPYWWAAVVDKARVIELANIYKLWIDTGESPVLIYSDSVYYLSSNPNPQEAFPGIFACGQKSGLGKYRHEGTWKVTQELIELFADTKQTPGKIVTFLNRAWEAQHNG